MALEIIDTHAHLDMPEFDSDREEVIQRAQQSGVSAIVTIGINPQSNRRAIQLAEQHPNIWAGIGIHPQDSKGLKYAEIQALTKIAGHPRVVAIGETGLDFYRDHASREDQMQALNWQLEVAKTAGLPVIIHCRQAQEAIQPVLAEWSASFVMPRDQPRGVLHCFNLDLKTAELYLAMGFFLSLGAYIGYPSSAALRETIKLLPLDRIVIETDCPFLPPQKQRGKRNEPSYTLSTLAVLAEIRQMPPEDAARQTTQNALRLFPTISGFQHSENKNIDNAHQP